MTSIQFGIYLPEEEEVEIKEEITSENELFIIASEIDPKYPEIYDALTGDQLVIALVDIELTSVDAAQADSANRYIHGMIKESSGIIAGKAAHSANKEMDKTIQQYALLKLQKGHIATTNPKITHGPTTASGTTRKVSMKTIYSNDGQKVKLLMADNLGYVKGGELVSTKGVDQIGRFSEKHWSRVTGIKGFLKNAGFIGSVMELTDMTMAVHNGKQLPPPNLIPFANLLTDMVLERTFGDLERAVDAALIKSFNELKSEGLSAVERAITRKSSFMKQRGYKTVKVSGENLAKVVSGEETNMENLLREYEPKPVATFLYRIVDNPKSASDIYLIETIFIH